MIIKFIEAEDTIQFNFGKFMLGRFLPKDWDYQSRIDPPVPLLRRNGRSPDELLVVDTQTGEGAFFRPGKNRSASSDLNDKHKIWVCPMFEPFLAWLYQQDLTVLEALPDTVTLVNPNPAIQGRRRGGAGL